MRCVALLPVVVGRVDYVAGASGAHLLRQLTIDLMRLVDEPGVRTGNLHLRSSLSPEHYRAIEQLPPVAATHDGVVLAHRAVCEVFLPLAWRTLGDARFPHVLATAVDERVGDLLDTALGPPRA